jgi:hypothetical protein
MSPAISELSLDERIAAAFGNGAKSEDVAALIKEAKAASLLCNDTAESARKRALDPVLSANDVSDARRQMEDAAFSVRPFAVRGDEIARAAGTGEDAGRGPRAAIGL